MKKKLCIDTKRLIIRPFETEDYNWAMMGYSIHNQYFRQGYGRESVIAASEFFSMSLTSIELNFISMWTTNRPKSWH
jgi:hypothetical protein